jgi:hypothetical protein
MVLPFLLLLSLGYPQFNYKPGVADKCNRVSLKLGLTMEEISIKLKDILGKNASLLIKDDALQHKEGFFHVRSAAEASERTATPDHPVTGDDEGKGVSGHDVPYGPRAARDAHACREPAVGHHTASGNLPVCQQDTSRKPFQASEIQIFQPEIDRVPCKKVTDLLANFILFSPPRNRIGKDIPYFSGHGAARFRKKDPLE